MSSADSSRRRPDYGIDAPYVIRNLFLVAALGFGLWGFQALTPWSGELVIPVASTTLVFPIARMGQGIGASCLILGVWMLWDSRVGKVRRCQRLLNLIRWSGSEQVLDVGCGRGLLMIAAAKRLTSGRATGIDSWKDEDLSGNRVEAALENARREGVIERVEIRTADMRSLPFDDGAFDVVVSRATIHNLYQVTERAQAISEIARVVKPGGHVLIEDIRHRPEYTAVLATRGFAQIERVDSPVIAWFLKILSSGSLQPGTIFARKQH